MGTLRLHYEEKIFWDLYVPFVLLKLKVTKIPIQNRPFLAPRAPLFSWLEAIDFKGPTFLYARDHAWSNGKDPLKSIALEKKIDNVEPYFSPSLLALFHLTVLPS